MPRPNQLAGRDPPATRPDQVVVDLQMLTDLLPLQKVAIDAIVDEKTGRSK
jgi:hypothetical protein